MNSRPEWCIENLLAKSSRPGYPEKNVSLETVAMWVGHVKEMGVQSIICLLTSKEQMDYYAQLPEGLLGYYRQQGLQVENISITDPAHYERGWCELEESLERICQAFKQLHKPVLVHCSAGMQRTGRAIKYIKERLQEEGRHGQ